MKQGSFYLRNNGRCIWPQVDVLEHFPERLLGMLAKTSRSPIPAYWFPSCRAIHTWGMRFAIDVVGLDKELRIVSVTRNLQPHRWLRLSGVSSIVECEAGCPLPLERWRGQALRFIAEQVTYDE